MGKTTNISWTKSTLNTAWGCTKVSAECLNCYMYRFSERLHIDATKVVIRIDTPWKLRAEIDKLNNLVFVNSMSDTFHKAIPDKMLDMWFDVFAEYPDKQFQILTKRPERAVSYFIGHDVPSNCWIGTSIGIKSAISRLDYLKQIEAPVRFVSAEPLLEDLGEIDFEGVNWVIIGGESDYQHPRPMQPSWAQNVIGQARKAGASVWFKQMGGIGGDGAGGEYLEGNKIQEYPKIYKVLA
jgi:protein gp37